MKTNINKLTNKIRICLTCFFYAIVPVSFQSFAGTWSTENNLSGMDSVHIYIPTTKPAINNKRALMINLHGCLMSNIDMKNNADWSPTADQFGMVVALPDVPGDGAFSIACWDYYGAEHSRNNKYNDEIINLAIELTNRKELNIDPNQVYITGFSSGGGQANIIACLAPDIFSGVGSFSGPGLGTTAGQYKSIPSNYSNVNQATLCENLAGKHTAYLHSQLYSTIQGSSDKIVDPEYNLHNADIMALVYGKIKPQKLSKLPIGGTNTIFSDSQGPRVSMITVSGMGHKWSTKSGSNTGYFTNNKVTYPNYVTKWFFDNNRRVTTTTEK
jgi:poly(3-hydroxybutyrate) depolymerase